MSPPSALWLAFLLLGLVFAAVSVVLLTSRAPGVFGGITLVCAVVSLVSAAVMYQRSRLRP